MVLRMVGFDNSSFFFGEKEFLELYVSKDFEIQAK